MFLLHARRQPSPSDDLLDFSGTITTGGTAQVLLPQQPFRSYLLIQNISSGLLTVGIGPAVATATVTSNKVASIAVNNAGLGYTVAPKVRLLGGVTVGLYESHQAKQFGFKPAIATATIAAGAISAVTVSDGGAGYQTPPYVYFENPYPDLGGGGYLPSATAGVQLQAGQAWIFNGTFCPTSGVNIFGATTGQAFVCKIAI